jgi:dolichyl-phosphate beta-glucosyltransferase
LKPSPFLSIIIPAFNEETRLPLSMEQVFTFLDKQSFSSEVIIVENGSTDRTLEVARSLMRAYPHLHVLHEDLPGKGRAVRRGMLEAGGEYRFFADADFSMPVQELLRFLPPACDADIAIASREAAGAFRSAEPVFRHFTGRVYNFWIRSLVLPGLQDTQCGFKCFRAATVQDIFPCQTLNGWAFDVELLAIARSRGYQTVEIGIPWHYYSGSKINVLQHSWRMFMDLLLIRKNFRNGVYKRPA